MRVSALSKDASIINVAWRTDASQAQAQSPAQAVSTIQLKLGGLEKQGAA